MNSAWKYTFFKITYISQSIRGGSGSEGLLRRGWDRGTDGDRRGTTSILFIMFDSMMYSKWLCTHLHEKKAFLWTECTDLVWNFVYGTVRIKKNPVWNLYGIFLESVWPPCNSYFFPHFTFHFYPPPSHSIFRVATHFPKKFRTNSVQDFF